MKFSFAINTLLLGAANAFGPTPKTAAFHRSSPLCATSGSLGCRPIGIGSAAPPTVITNSDLENVVETSDEWIQTRTGIAKRHVLVGDESIKNLGTQAAQQALTMSGIDPLDIDLVIYATSSPDDLFGDATSIAANLGCTNAMGFDLTAACSGFLFGIVTAGQFLHNKSMKNALVVGADALSRWVDWDDRNSCILFGDGAGAMVLTADDACPGLLGYSAHSNGLGYDKLKLG
jgi:3-oxoacyl-[acyl-carrier-protein] synthase III